MFFSSKRPVLPLLNGFVDIHCHVLPGLDDGAKNMENTREMLWEYQKMGFKKVIATPHILKGSYPNTRESIFLAFNKVKEELKGTSERDILQHASAEHMLDEGFEILLKENTVLPLHEKYLLIEMSYFQKPVNLSEILFNIGHKGYTPVLAHPERYNFIDKEGEFHQLKKTGCLFQLNFLSLSGHYGPQVQKKAHLLLKNGMYDFAATDAHHSNHLQRIARLTVTKKDYEKLRRIIDNTLYIYS